MYRERVIVDCLSKRSERACVCVFVCMFECVCIHIFAGVIIWFFLLNFFHTTCRPDLISAIFRQLITILQPKYNMVCIQAISWIARVNAVACHKQNVRSVRVKEQKGKHDSSQMRSFAHARARALAHTTV